MKHKLNAQVEELKMKVNNLSGILVVLMLLLRYCIFYHMQLYKIELEREQLQHTIESTKNRHSEEIESIQKSNEYVRDCVCIFLFFVLYFQVKTESFGRVCSEKRSKVIIILYTVLYAVNVKSG